MMRKVIFVLFCIISLKVASQTDKKFEQQPPLTNSQRFLLDYEIKGWNLTIQDTVKLNKINLDTYEQSRKTADDIELFDQSSGLTILLYSVNRAVSNKNK